MANCVQCGRKLPGLSFGKKLCQWCVQNEAAKRGEDGDNAVQRVEAPPWVRSESTSMVVTQVIFGINVAVFLGMLFAGVSILDNPSGQDLVHWGANYGPYTVSGQWWRLLTCVFVHGSFIHIAFNMWCLWSLGSLAESLYGHWTFGAVYFIAGIAGSVVSIAWHPNVLSVGASGAIFGIAGALLSSFYLGEFSMPRIAVMGTLRSVALFVGINLYLGAVSSTTDNGAHVGGLVAGLILGALIAKAAPHSDAVVPRIGVLLFGALLVFGGVAWLHHSRAYSSHLAKAQQFLAQDRTDQAIAELQSALRQQPGFIPVRITLARAYARKNDFTNAEAELKRVLAIDPKSEVGYSNLGFVYLEEDRLPEARQAFTQLLSMSPNSVPGHFGIANVLSAEEKYPEALEEYKVVLKLDPESEGAYYNMGLAQTKMKMYDEAIASFRKEQEESGDDSDIESALARTYEAKGMQREAEEARKKASELKNQ